MTVDIYIREKGGTREIRVPILPEKIKCTSGDADFVTYSIMNRGDVSVPTGVGLAGIAWESEFPGENRKSDPMIHGSWKAPKHYESILNDWKKKGTTLVVLVTGYPINKDVYLSKYESEPYGAFGDIAYEVEFQEARTITIKSTKVSITKKSSTTKRTSSVVKTYIIKSGDTLWGISAKCYGTGTKWKTIYNANKKIIEATAKKHGKKSSNNGHWIYPGVKLTIPR